MFGKAIVFITCMNQPKEILALFHPTAGVQIPKGTIEFNELPETAAIREGVEETGLKDLKMRCHIKTVSKVLDDDKRYISRSTKVFSRPDMSSFDWADLRRGILVSVLREQDEYHQIEYIEYDDLESSVISYQITGWVPKACLTQDYLWHFYHLETNETLDYWTNFDDNHQFEFKWISLDEMYKFNVNHRKWIEEIYIPYVKHIEKSNDDESYTV